MKKNIDKGITQNWDIRTEVKASMSDVRFSKVTLSKGREIEGYL